MPEFGLLLFELVTNKPLGGRGCRGAKKFGHKILSLSEGSRPTVNLVRFAQGPEMLTKLRVLAAGFCWSSWVMVNQKA